MDEFAIRKRPDGRMYESLAWSRRPPPDPAATALVVIDMINHQLQLGRTAPGSWMARGGVDPAYYLERVERMLIPNHQRLLATARAAGAMVVYLRVGCQRTDFADAVPGLRGRLSEWDALDGGWACQVDPRIAPQPGDLSLLKTGSGGFTSSALDVHLRNAKIRNVVYTGVVTNGCVLSTALAGFDLGYEGYVVGDATATLSAPLQQAAEDILSGVYAQVVSTDDMVRALEGAPAAARQGAAGR